MTKEEISNALDMTLHDMMSNPRAYARLLSAIADLQDRKNADVGSAEVFGRRFFEFN